MHVLAVIFLFRWRFFCVSTSAASLAVALPAVDTAYVPASLTLYPCADGTYRTVCPALQLCADGAYRTACATAAPAPSASQR